MKKVEIDYELCKGCDICLRSCPQDVFRETEKISASGFRIREPVNFENCTECGLCRYFCPEGAIKLKGEQLIKEFWRNALSNREFAIARNKPRNGWKIVKSNFPGRHFLSGNMACVYGALDAGCRFFASYPITPVNEQAFEMEKRMPDLGGIFIQMENEDACLAAMCGASLAGLKVMTSTSGPGFSRMQENLSFALANEIPMVIVNAQRTGPSTGRPTGTGAGEVRESRWGSHGGTEHIVLCPSSVQEVYDLTVKAFNLSEMFRVPVIVLMEASTAHLVERVEIPEEVQVYDRVYVPGAPPFGPTDGVPSLPKFGDGELLKVTGLTHNEWGVPCPNDPQVHEEMVKYLRNKIVSKAEELTDVEEFLLDDAEIMIIAYGTTARSARWAVKKVRERGVKAGLLVIRTLFPFPENEVRRWSSKVKCILVPEMNQGQLHYIVRESALCPVISLPQPDGEAIDPRRILRILEADLTKYYRKGDHPPISTIYDPPEWWKEKGEKAKHEFGYKTIYCPGCGLGILRNCVLEALRELNIDFRKMLVVSGIGCAGRMSLHLPFDSAHTTHGYPTAFATGAKLANPDLEVMVISGDGDLFDIGAAHTLHAARRNIPIAVVCVNNLNFAQTGGQAAATTPFGAITSTTTQGSRTIPFDLVKLVLGANASFVARCPISKYITLKEILKDAIDFNGFAFVEVIDPCITYYARTNKVGSAAEVHKRLNETYVPKERAKHLSKKELEVRFKKLFPWRKDLCPEIKVDELLQIFYGKFDCLKEYVSLVAD